MEADAAWLVHKLQHDWSSCELGPLLSRERVLAASKGFGRLEAVVKTRALLALLSAPREVVTDCEREVEALLRRAEEDSEEWVKVTAGIVRQYLFARPDEAPADGAFLRTQLDAASAAVLQVVDARKDHADSLVIEDFFCDENAYLSPSVRPEMTVRPAAHFTVCEDVRASHNNDDKARRSVEKKLQARPQMNRSSSLLAAAARLAPSAAKMPPKRSMTELSSEIRRKADAGRFKRQRSRISVIDLDEVKQIETEKALKAEEQRKKLKAAKEMKAQAASQSQSQGQANQTPTQASPQKADKPVASSTEGSVDAMPPPVPLPVAAAAAAFADLTPPIMPGIEEEDDGMMHGNMNDAHPNYGQDGTQVLLNAAFHSTQDVMNEVVAQQQMQHTYGHEPEDVNHSAYAFPFPGAFGTQFHETPMGYPDNQQYPPANNGFVPMDEQTAQMQAGTRLARFDSAFGQNRSSSGFHDGPPPPEYWR